jgi:Uma2 family endonuclease
VKHELYARFGVKEYWICDAANEGLEIFTLKDTKYELHCAENIKGKVSSLVLVGLEFDLADIH